MLPDEFDESVGIGLPVHREAFEVFENGVNAEAHKERDCVFRVLVEVGVENPLVHKVQSRTDVEQHPAKIMKLERSEKVGKSRDRSLDRISIFANGCFPTL